MTDENKKPRGFKLGDISPLAGLVTGEGLTGTVLGGLAPMAIRKLMDRGEGEEEEMVAVKKGPGMKKGGKVGSSCMKKGGSVKSKPMAKYASGGMVKADGCAMRGKTRGKEC